LLARPVIMGTRTFSLLWSYWYWNWKESCATYDQPPQNIVSGSRNGK
jgi:hypothetical protein